MKLIINIYKFLLYLFSLYIILVFSLTNYIDNIYINISYYYLNLIFKNNLFIYIFSVIYFVLISLNILLKISKKDDLIEIKLEKGIISLKINSLCNFIELYLTQNDLIERAKVKVNKKGKNKVEVNAMIYTYSISEISNRLLEIQEDLLKEIEDKLAYKLDKINIVIENLKVSKNEFKIKDKKDEEKKVEENYDLEMNEDENNIY